MVPLPGAAAKVAAEAVSAYQAQVKATCARLDTIKASGDNALSVETMGPDGPVLSAQQVVALFDSQLSQRRTKVTALWQRDVPASLAAARLAAIKAEDDNENAAADFLSKIKAFGVRLTQKQLDGLTADFLHDHPDLGARLTSSFNTLAGGTCQTR